MLKGKGSGLQRKKRLAPGEITEKRRASEDRFVDEYCKDFNGTQAAIRAGFSAKTAHVQYAKLLKIPRIQQLITDRRKSLAIVARMSQEQWVKRLEYLSRANIKKLVQWDKDGHTLQVKASEEMTDQEAWLISEISQSKGKYGDSLKIKLTDKLSALIELGKALGYYPKKEKDGDTYNQQVNINLHRANDPMDLSALSQEEKAQFRAMLAKMSPKVIDVSKDQA